MSKKIGTNLIEFKRASATPASRLQVKSVRVYNLNQNILASLYQTMSAVDATILPAVHLYFFKNLNKKKFEREGEKWYFQQVASSAFEMANKYDFSQVDALKKKLDTHKPLDAVLYQKIRKKLHLDWTYHSNAIEGNTLSFSETQFYINFGLTSKGHALSEYLEIKNHQHALEYLEEIVREKTPLSERLMKEFHAMLFKRNEEYVIENEHGQKITKNVMPGAYKKEKNYVLLPDGNIKWYLDPLKVVDAMQDLVSFYEEQKEKLHPILLATELHARFVHIHPFNDGNGRTARMIMNIVLMQSGYAPAIIQNEDKQEYFAVLQKYDETNDISDFVAIVEREVTRVLQIMLNAVEGGTILDQEDIGKRLGNFGKKMEALDKDVGKFSKKVSKEEKEESIRKIRDYLYGIAKKRIGDFESKDFKFSVESQYRLEEFFLLPLTSWIKHKNIRLELKEVPGSYLDFLPKEKGGSAFVVKIKSKKLFVPTSEVCFAVFPTKYTLCVGFLIKILGLNNNDDESDTSDTNTASNFIQNGVLWEDWHKQDLDNFFNEVFDQFLGMVEHEAEQRRIHIAERNENS